MFPWSLSAILLYARHMLFITRVSNYSHLCSWTGINHHCGDNGCNSIQVLIITEHEICGGNLRFYLAHVTEALRFLKTECLGSGPFTVLKWFQSITSCKLNGGSDTVKVWEIHFYSTLLELPHNHPEEGCKAILTQNSGAVHQDLLSTNSSLWSSSILENYLYGWEHIFDNCCIKNSCDSCKGSNYSKVAGLILTLLVTNLKKLLEILDALTTYYWLILLFFCTGFITASPGGNMWVIE